MTMTRETRQPGETRLFTARDVPVGRLQGSDTFGYSGFALSVTVDVRIDRHTFADGDGHETVNHDKVNEYDTYAITSAVWRPDYSDILSGGATVEPLREVIECGKYAKGMDAGVVGALAATVEWHLNGLQAACAHMTPVGETVDERLDNTPPCPVTGYRYGRAWLVRTLPDGFTEHLLDLFANVDQTRIYYHGRDNYAARGYDMHGGAI